MHGRLKVKDKAEIQAEKKKKYQEKAIAFKAGLDQCLKSKSEGDYNSDVMRITWNLLCANPDVYTIWNMRKEFIMNKKADYERQLEELKASLAAEANKPKADEEVGREGGTEAAGTEPKEANFKKNPEDHLECDSGDHPGDHREDQAKLKASDEPEAGEPNASESDAVDVPKPPTEEELTDEFQKLCDVELELTECALLKNAKSYSAWNHRLWILSLIPRPDFQREFRLNEAYLQKDGRNLHCWYYRTNLCQISGRDLKDEVKFSLDKIKDDLSAFSYSTLVYRSLVLTKASELGLVDFSKCWKDEYSLIENGLFTEPSDQALWFYLRWLLLIDFGRCMSLEQQSAEVVPVRVVLNKQSRMLIFRFNKLVKRFPFDEVRLGSAGRIIESDLQSVEHRPSKLWYVRLTTEQEFDEVQLKNTTTELNLRLKDLTNYRLWVDAEHQDELAVSRSRMQIQSEQLQSLIELKGLEPDNKWLNLILSYFENTDRLQILDDLCKLDPLRTNYYEDQKSRIKLEKQIVALDEDAVSADLSKLQLTVLYTPEPFAHLNTLILTGNRISCLTSNLNCLVSLKILVLDDNLIYKIQKKFALVSLEVLSIQNNKLSPHSGIGHLTSCPNLKQLYLFGNQLSEDDLELLTRKQINCHLKLERD